VAVSALSDVGFSRVTVDLRLCGVDGVAASRVTNPSPASPFFVLIQTRLESLGDLGIGLEDRFGQRGAVVDLCATRLGRSFWRLVGIDGVAGDTTSAKEHFLSALTSPPPLFTIVATMSEFILSDPLC
jgi:hypothetical protein